MSTSSTPNPLVPITLTLVSLMLALGGCAVEPESAAREEALERVPDAEAGYRFLANGNYIGCGIPTDVMERATRTTAWVPRGLVDTLFPLASDEVFTDPGIPGREGTNAGIARSYNAFVTKRGVEAINFSCLSCHSERINGEVVIGLGNTSRDFTQDLRRMTDLLPAFAHTDAERAELARFRDSMQAIAPYIQTKTVGTNPAINLTYALFARRDAHTFEWTDAPQIEPPSRRFPPIDVPPWWRMSKRDTMFYNGEFAQNHHRIVALASVLCIDTAEEMRALEDSFRDVEAYLDTVEPPRYPGPIDDQLAAQGEGIFEATCAGCHGTYGPGGVYEEKVIPIGVVGTDPGLMEQQTGPASERFRDWGGVGFQTLYGEDIHVEPKRGYVAPPLDGVWATAPYFHNGSVPSMEGVLDSSARPRYWSRDFSSDEYDIANMAQPYWSMPYGQRWAWPGTKRYIYDTTLEHHGNGGHTFGDHLSEAERRAVMEYLKTL